jgi:hypothetical protein
MSASRKSVGLRDHADNRDVLILNAFVPYAQSRWEFQRMIRRMIQSVKDVSAVKITCQSSYSERTYKPLSIRNVSRN